MEVLLEVGGEFGAGGGDVEDVDGFVGFGGDEDDFDVAAGFGEGGGEVVEESGAILGDDFDEGGGGGGGGVEGNGGADAAVFAGRVGLGAVAEKGFGVEAPEEDALENVLEAL